MTVLDRTGALAGAAASAPHAEFVTATRTAATSGEEGAGRPLLAMAAAAIAAERASA
eukprot:CAMPEP_0194294194 /NCGR_PEP_ID=MMETSP0169-20130528/49953_1 /TAXON_ID=218684 /ORGANISM="Corethron pennatum, Strain L29A3" /LENGTH=56 /DNA_ID=CAMNT_0039042971 /DNA_START=37 /DNA_END=203 /DNA_ORIENTATION=+